MGYPRADLTTGDLKTSIAVLAVVAVTVPRLAAAHVAPSTDDNNRYLKVTPSGDRVRVAYTVFFGEVPGAIERRTLDANRDGTISDAEGHDFGTKIATQVAASLDVEVDGHTSPFAWSTVDVGMGTPAVGAGSFSIDLVGYACLPVLRGGHHLVIHDRFRLPHPGETEVKVEDAPGVTITRAHVGPADDPSHDYKFAGPGGPISDDGLDLEFTAGPHAAVTADATCAALGAAGARGWWVYVAIGGAVGVLGVGAAILRRRLAL
jgi:hypothetical protein